MIQPFEKIPYAIPFHFASVDDDARRQLEVLIPYNVAIYGITVTASVSNQLTFYRASLQFMDYQTGDTLFDEPLSNFCLQSDARTFWKLPSTWFVKKNSKLICAVDSDDSVVATSYYVTLLAYVVDSDPNPGVQPFVYSFPILVGFQDNVGGGATSVPFNQGLTATMSKHMLYDFEIHAIAFNAQSTGLSYPMMSFQLSTQRRKLFDRFIINGNAGGGSVFCQGDNFDWMNSLANNHAFPEDAILQYKLAQPERVCKGELVRVDVSPAPTYVPTGSIHTFLNQPTCMAVIGNHYAS